MTSESSCTCVLPRNKATCNGFTVKMLDLPHSKVMDSENSRVFLRSREVLTDRKCFKGGCSNISGRCSIHQTSVWCLTNDYAEERWHVSTGVAKLFITIFKESQSPAVGFLYQYQVEEPRKTLAFPSWAEHLQGLRQSDMTASCLISSTVQALRQRLDAESSFFQRLQLDGKGKVRKEMWCKLPSLILKRLKDIVSLIIASLFSKSYQGHGF